ncbi:hypothetical protein DPMN_188672 [Dreissena polymorpha]|uniref:Uncharacterized protein n=1 Tax=Dreissena polymorpha TaxID=45954 RepID=A0A9D4IA93_DREPO|nr:hypothetical protein DPMN_188672 [Dreissena polymorpha]
MAAPLTLEPHTYAVSYNVNGVIRMVGNTWNVLGTLNRTNLPSFIVKLRQISTPPITSEQSTYDVSYKGSGVNGRDT